MKVHNKLWNNGEVEICNGDFRSSESSSTTVAEALKRIKDRNIRPHSVCCLTAGWNEQKGIYLQLGYWDPYSHPSPCHWQMILCFRPWTQIQDPYPTFVWNRSGTPPVLSAKPHHGKWEKNKTMKIAAGFDALFHLLVQMDIQRLAIKELKHDLAGEIMSWHFKLASKNGICKIPHVEFPGHSVAVSSSARRELSLCSSLIRDGPTSIAFERLGKNYNQAGICRLLEAAQDSNILKNLDLRTCLQIDDMYREIPVAHEGPYMHPTDNFEAGAPASPLIAALVSTNCSITNVNLGGLRLTPSSAMQLALHLNSCKSLERLGLRATCLNEEALVVLFEQGLALNSSLKELDVSWNTFTPKVMQALCDALKANCTLEKLRVEHCGIDLDLVQMLSSALGGFQGIRHLSLDGNTFAWTPLINGESDGVLSLVKGMTSNLSLWSLKVGEYGMVGSVSRVCCTGPTYTEHIGLVTRYELQNFFQRNQRLHREKKWLRMKLAVVRIADFLLRKTDMNREEPRGRL
jgi:hypothetical protein